MQLKMVQTGRPSFHKEGSRSRRQLRVVLPSHSSTRGPQPTVIMFDMPETIPNLYQCWRVDAESDAGFQTRLSKVPVSLGRLGCISPKVHT